MIYRNISESPHFAHYWTNKRALFKIPHKLKTNLYVNITGNIKYLSTFKRAKERRLSWWSHCWWCGLWLAVQSDLRRSKKNDGICACLHFIWIICLPFKVSGALTVPSALFSHPPFPWPISKHCIFVLKLLFNMTFAVLLSALIKSICVTAIARPHTRADA